jgi:hypothetical protein
MRAPSGDSETSRGARTRRSRPRSSPKRRRDPGAVGSKVDQDARKRGVDIHRHLVAIEREITLAEQLVHPATRRLNAS